jgi:hypothetical protein
MGTFHVAFQRRAPPHAGVFGAGAAGDFGALVSCCWWLTAQWGAVAAVGLVPGAGAMTVPTDPDPAPGGVPAIVVWQ